MDSLGSYTFSSRLMVRTPAYSYRQYDASDGNMATLLRDNFFQAAIFLASESLYTAARAAGFEYNSLPQKAKLALRKYYNRMCFRSTPFGLFSGVSTSKWGEGQDILMDTSFRPAVLFSFGYVAAATSKWTDSVLQDYLSYSPNDSLYRVKASYRYIRYDDDPTSGRRKFSLHEVEATEILCSLAGYCTQGKTRHELAYFIDDAYATGMERSLAYVEELIGIQFLMSPFHANIIDKDYLESFSLSWSGVGHRDALEVDRLQSPSSLYVNLNKVILSGDLSTSYQQGIKEGLHCISHLLPSDPPTGLKRFVNAFKAKFDLRVVPLIAALDPEVGVDYEHLASISSAPVILETLNNGSMDGSVAYNVAWTPAHALLLQKWQRPDIVSGTVQITITDDDLARMPAPSSSCQVPNSISVMFRMLDDAVFIEGAGGITATSLLARFTVFNEDIWKECKAIAQSVQLANPEVIFAAISHFSDPHTADIERQLPVWDYELLLFNGSSHTPEKQVPLSDLYIAVQGDDIKLWSRKHNKIVIPVLNSAYNYARSDLAVYRFLCDLQHQGVCSSFNFDLNLFFPGLDYYPRVVYKGSILSLATWNINKQRIAGIAGKSVVERLAALKEFVEELQLPALVSVNEHDNQLVFDTSHDHELEILWELVKNSPSAVIKEFPFPESKELVREPSGLPYLPQMVASMVHHREIYKNCELKPYMAIRKRTFIVGSEWLYFKLYCHPARSNELLCNYISPFAGELKDNGNLRQWFFIRYNDPAYHLRVRLQVTEKGVGEAVSLMEARFAGLVEEGIISSFQLGVYERELERYGEGIEDIETWFSISSSHVVSLLGNCARYGTAFDPIASALTDIDGMCYAFSLGTDNMINLFEGLFKSMSAEFSISLIQNEELKKEYRKVKEAKLLPGNRPSTQADYFDKTTFEAASSQLSGSIKDIGPVNREQLFSDLLHMHLNRLFVDNGRQQEMFIYYCLWKHYRSVKAVAGKAIPVCS